MSLNREIRGHAKSVALVGWSTLFWIAFWIAPYLYALNDLIQWR